MTKTKYLIGTIFLLILLAGLILFNNQAGAPQNYGSKITVVTSFYPLYYFSERIGGDKADVYNITPAGAEPHDYELTARDIALVESSNLLVLNGRNLEVWGDNIKKNLNPGQTILVMAGESLISQRTVDGDENIVDPHVWLSPTLAEEMVDKILGGFQASDPANISYYTANAEALKEDLKSLNADYSVGLKNCALKDIITSHASFGYLALAYDLRQISIAGLSPDAEPSPREIGEIAKLAKENGVKYIFFESLASPKLSETIATEVGAKTLVLNPLEGLTKADIQAGKNYFTEMRNNLNNLKIALECK